MSEMLLAGGIQMSTSATNIYGAVYAVISTDTSEDYLTQLIVDRDCTINNLRVLFYTTCSVGVTLTWRVDNAATPLSIIIPSGSQIGYKQLPINVKAGSLICMHASKASSAAVIRIKWASSLIYGA